MKALLHHSYEFESFRIDAVERRLWRDGRIVPLTSKTFDILMALVENPGRTIEKDELMHRVWADTFVEEGNLNRNISTLRKVLGDDRHGQRFIRTIPKQGYRFTADVREIGPDERSTLVEKKTSVRLNVWDETVETLESVSSRFRFWLAIAFGLILVAAAATMWMWSMADVDATSPQALKKNARNADAVKVYEEGRALWQTRSGEDLYRATVLLEQAVQKDPSFALAYSALADAYAFDYRHWKKAESTAREAIKLDPNLGEPHATIGFVKMFWEWKISEAEAEFKHAISLSPNYATAHHWYALNLLANGNSGSAALVEMKRALELEPDSISINADLCQTYYFLRRYDDAISQCQKTLTMDAGYYNAHSYLYEIYNANGMADEAVKTYFKIEEISVMPSPPGAQQELRDAFQKGGIRAFWEKRIDALPKALPNRYRAAKYFARLGNKTEALSNLRKAYETRDFEFVMVLADPVFDELRNQLGYLELKDLLLN